MEPKKEKKFLILVDMQNDFIDGALGTPEAVSIVPKVVNRVQKALEDGECVIATLDTHGEDYMETREGRKLPVPHCIRGTEGWRIRPEIMSLLGGAVFVEKLTFGSTRLPGIVEELSGGGPFSVELCGLCTDICVVSNAMLLKARFPEAEISVRGDCCAGVTPEKHLAALETIASCQIEII